ncbi:hypothetical protein ACFX14_018915 [Malus domestica]
MTLLLAAAISNQMARPVLNDKVSVPDLSSPAPVTSLPFCGVDQEIWVECKPERWLDQLQLLMFYVVGRLSHLIVLDREDERKRIKEERGFGDDYLPLEKSSGPSMADALTVDRLASLVKYSETAMAPRASILKTEPPLLHSRQAESNEKSLDSRIVLSLSREELVEEVDGDLDAGT